MNNICSYFSRSCSTQPGHSSQVFPKDQFKPNFWQKTQKCLFTFLGASSAYSLFDEGLARVLGLDTLRHGDSFGRYLSGRLFGVDPATRNGMIGSCAGFSYITDGVIQDCPKMSKNYYYVFKDVFPKVAPFGTRYDIIPKMVAPRLHAVLSGISNAGKEGVGEFSRYMRLIVGGIDGMLAPTLKFRFRPDDLSHFENDPDYENMAFRTTSKISSMHTGIIGSFWQGLDSGLVQRIKNDPESALMGVVLIGLSILVAKKTYDYYKSSVKIDQSQCSKAKSIAKITTLTFLNTL